MGWVSVESADGSQLLERADGSEQHGDEQHGGGGSGLKEEQKREQRQKEDEHQAKENTQEAEEPKQQYEHEQQQEGPGPEQEQEQEQEEKREEKEDQQGQGQGQGQGQAQAQAQVQEHEQDQDQDQKRELVEFEVECPAGCGPGDTIRGGEIPPGVDAGEAFTVELEQAPTSASSEDAGLSIANRNEDDHAATRIQSMYRGSMARARLNDCARGQAKQTRAALVCRIQSVQRGRRLRLGCHQQAFLLQSINQQFVSCSRVLKKILDLNQYLRV